MNKENKKLTCCSNIINGALWLVALGMLLALITQACNIKANAYKAPTETEIESVTYTTTAIVSSTEPHSDTEDIVCVVDSNGNVFSFYADTNTYKIKDSVSCTIRTNGTGDVWDNEVINAIKGK